MTSRVVFYLLQLRKRLWAKPLLFCLSAVAGALVALYADRLGVEDYVPNIRQETIRSLLTIISSSMLAVTTFAVGSMVAAYNSASRSATPRAFTLIIADDLSQWALSSFIGAFIFSVVALIALQLELYGRAGLFVLFLLTLLSFAWVVLTLVAWIDNIARLGQMENTIEKVEDATVRSVCARGKAPYLGGAGHDGGEFSGFAVTAPTVGYVQHIDMAKLQEVAKKLDTRLFLNALPGHLLEKSQPLVTLETDAEPDKETCEKLCAAFVIGRNRTFESDPRFGLIVMSEIAARALSPGINDFGTAIAIIGRLVSVFTAFSETIAKVREEGEDEVRFDRVLVPAIGLDQMFDDAFGPIARDGADKVEIGIRLQKALAVLARLDLDGIEEIATRHSEYAMEHARSALRSEHDLSRVEEAAKRLKD